LRKDGVAGTAEVVFDAERCGIFDALTMKN
jgi:hypothetical protein